MPDTEKPLDLAPLDSDYSIVGELGNTSNCRTLIAERKHNDSKRRDDQTGVVISIYCTPEGDEANALSHLAADTKVLASEGHRRLVPVVEGRWLGDHFAVVTQRIGDTTIAQRLQSREVFSTIRIAAILRELNGLLEWARDRGIVHRILTAGSVYLEPRTDRVRVMFDVTPIHRVRPPEETRDARTIARLAMAMLAGMEDPDTCNVDTLHDMRPELPERLAAATAELLDVKNASTKTDIVNFIALIGMSDPLYRGEEEEKRIRAEILEEQRSEREKLANERTAFETMIATERSDFAELMSKERAEFQAKMEGEREKLETERVALQKAVADERAKLQKAMTDERADLTTMRTELEKSIAAQKTELERVAVLDRKQIDALRAELKQRGEAEIEQKRVAALEDVEDSSESELDDEELATPIFVGPNLMPLEALKFDETNALLMGTAVEFTPIAPQEPIVAERELVAAGGDDGGRRKWLMPSAIGGGVFVIALAVLAATFNHDLGAPTPTPAPVAKVAQVAAAPGPVQPRWAVPLPAAGQIVDSASGSIAPNADSIAAADSARVARAAARARRERQQARARADSARALQAPEDSIFNFRKSKPDTTKPF